MLTIQELRQLPAKDLNDELERVSREYLKMKMDVEEGFAKSTHKAKTLRRQIARIRTVETELRRELAAQPAKEEAVKEEEPKKEKKAPKESSRATKKTTAKKTTKK